MTNTSTRTSRKASATRPPASAPAQAPAAEESRADIYQRITDRIAAAIEAGAGRVADAVAPGRRWGNAACCRSMPQLASHTEGVNTVVLWATAQAEGYPRRRLGHIPAMGRAWARRSAKASSASPVVFWKINGPDEGEDSGTGGSAGDAAGDEGAEDGPPVPRCSRAATACSTRPRWMRLREAPALPVLARGRSAYRPRRGVLRRDRRRHPAWRQPRLLRAEPGPDQDAAVRGVPRSRSPTMPPWPMRRRT